mmetsp:Transcript_17231/g.60162  ORF Transcript_17231/g.60162 Transcript_17231/m.60162 type:complete len:884 (-) Transcript_17231:48-2699(-)
MMDAIARGSEGAVDLHTSGEHGDLWTRWTLRQAMHSRKVHELRSAIALAETSNALYDVELYHARVALELERKARAFERFAEAKFMRDVKAMLVAIEEGKEFGLGVEELAAVEAESRRDAAHLRLEELSAPDSGASIRDFHDALAEAQASGLDEFELELAKGAMVLEEQRAAARQILFDAVKSRKQSELRAALKLGAQHGLQDWELFEAERTLLEEERRVLAKGQLKDALLKKSFDKREQIDCLGEAIEEAAQAGLEIMEVERARWFFEYEERQFQAREVVARAIASKRFDELQQAWIEALETGLKKEEINEVKALMDESKKPAARERLKLAVESRDIPELKAAIAHGIEAGISVVGLTPARTALRDEERKIEARARLANLIGEGPLIVTKICLLEFPTTCTIGELRAAVKFGEVTGLSHCELQRGSSIMQAEEHRLKARASIAKVEREAAEAFAFAETAAAAAPASGDQDENEEPEVDVAERRRFIEERARYITNLTEIIVRCEEAGLIELELLGIRQLLDEAIRARAGAGLTVALQGKGAAVIEPLKLAIAEAEAAGFGAEDLAGPLHVVETEERKVAARHMLEEALRLMEVEALRAAVQQGEAAGLAFPELRPARDMLTLQQKRKDARQLLQGLLSNITDHPPSEQQERCDTIDRLKEAIRQGGTAKLEDLELERPREVRAEQEQKFAAANMLCQALESGEIREIREAVQEGRCAGLAEAELDAAELCLSGLLLQRAQAALDRALVSRKVDDLRYAIKAAEAAFMDPSEFELHRQVQAEEHLTLAIRQRASHDLEAAIAFAEVWLPESGDLPIARDLLEKERRRDHARLVLKQVHQKSGCHDGHLLHELLAAIREGQNAGLEDWELSFARKAVTDQRRLVA